MSNETAILQSESACSGHVQEGLTFSESAPAAALPDGLDLLETDAGLTLAGDGMTLRADFSEMIPASSKVAFSRSFWCAPPR